MKIALIGYGAMGKIIETLAENKNHEIAVIIDESDANLSAAKLAEKLKRLQPITLIQTQIKLFRFLPQSKRKHHSNP